MHLQLPLCTRRLTPIPRLPFVSLNESFSLFVLALVSVTPCSLFTEAAGSVNLLTNISKHFTAYCSLSTSSLHA